MGAGLGCHLHTPLLCAAYDVHCHGAGNVGNVHRDVQILREHDVTRNLYGLAYHGLAHDTEFCAHLALVHEIARGKLIVLAVVRELQAQIPGVLHGPAHEFRVGHGATVIGDAHAACLLELSQGREPLALEAGGGSSCGKEPRSMGMGLFGLFQHVARDCRAVVHGFGVGHADDGAKATVCRSLKPGVYVFLVLEAGIAKMHMAVREGRQEHKPLCVHLFDIPGALALGNHGDNAAVLDKNVDLRSKIQCVGQAKFHISLRKGQGLFLPPSKNLRVLLMRKMVWKETLGASCCACRAGRARPCARQRLQRPDPGPGTARCPPRRWLFPSLCSWDRGEARLRPCWPS